MAATQDTRRVSLQDTEPQRATNVLTVSLAFEICMHCSQVF